MRQNSSIMNMMVLDFLIEGYLQSNKNYALLAAFAAVSSRVADLIVTRLSSHLSLGSLIHHASITSSSLCILSNKPVRRARKSRSILLCGYCQESNSYEEWPLYLVASITDCFSSLEKKHLSYVTWSGWWQSSPPEWCLLHHHQVFVCGEEVLVEFRGQKSVASLSFFLSTHFRAKRERAEQLLTQIRNLRVGDIIQTSASHRSLSGEGVIRELLLIHKPLMGPLCCMAHCTLDQGSAWTPTPYSCDKAHTVDVRTQKMLVLNFAGKQEPLPTHCDLLCSAEIKEQQQDDHANFHKRYKDHYACFQLDPCRNLFQVTKTVVFYHSKFIRLTCLTTAHDFLVSLARFEKEFISHPNLHMLRSCIEKLKQERNDAIAKLKPGDLVCHTSQTRNLCIVNMIENPQQQHNSRLYRCWVPHTDIQTKFISLDPGCVSDAVLMQESTRVTISPELTLCLGDVVIYTLSRQKRNRGISDSVLDLHKRMCIISRIITGVEGQGPYMVVLSYPMTTHDGSSATLHTLEDRLGRLQFVFRQSSVLQLLCICPVVDEEEEEDDHEMEEEEEKEEENDGVESKRQKIELY